MGKAPLPLREAIALDREAAKESGQLRQTVTIGSEGPLICSSGRCAAITRQITDGSEYVLVNTRKGMILLHLICAGISPNGNLGSLSYQRYIGSQLIRRLQE